MACNENTIKDKNEIISSGINSIMNRFSGQGNMVARIQEELRELVELEIKYGFLSSIGLKILFDCNLHNHNQIEGSIKAPENSPYKNGIFHFVLKYPDNYPENPPSIFFKTKILHFEVRESDGYCCLSLFFSREKEYHLYQIIGIIYDLFVNLNPMDAYQNEATRLFKEDPSLFYKKCEEYVEIYAGKEFNNKLEYVFQDIYAPKFNESKDDLLFVSLIGKPKEIRMKKSKIHDDMYIGELINKLSETMCERFQKEEFIIGNKVYHRYNNEKFINNQIIFIIPNLYKYCS